MKKMLCLVGESGSGKTTIAEKLEELGHRILPSYTTRHRRHEGEKHHTFIDEEEFQKIRGEMVAYTKFNNYEYGATRKQISENEVYVIDLTGLDSLIENIGREHFFNVYISVPEEERLFRMTKTRNETEALKRIEHDRIAFKSYPAHRMDLILRNTSPAQLEYNVALLHDFLEKQKRR